jgi:ATP-dependent helicase HrpA
MRYVVALDHRLARLPRRVDADAAATGSLRRLEAEVDRAAASIADPVAVEGLHWMLEELRVATFAEQVGTREPVSETRVRKAMQRAVAGQPIRSGGHG